MTSQRAKLQQQVPDILSNLELIKILKKRNEDIEPTEQYFRVNDAMYVKAECPPTKTVNIWLGANVMLEYEFDEAEELQKIVKQSSFENVCVCFDVKSQFFVHSKPIWKLPIRN